jgi:membrane associated rhomboid family serine protease
MSDPRDQPSYRLRRPGGEVDPSRIFNTPGVVLAIVLLTVAVFVLMIILPDRTASIIEFAAAVLPLRLMAGPAANGGFLAMASPLIAHMFFHAGIAHLLMNMAFLLAFGTPVARRMGADNALKSSAAFASASLFLTLYLLSGIVGALTYVGLHVNDYALLIGASGGVSGLLGALVRFAFNRSTLFGPEAAKLSPLLSSGVLTWTGVFVGTNIVFGAFGGALTGALSGDGNIAWEAHLGGYFFGLLAFPFFDRAARAFR